MRIAINETYRGHVLSRVLDPGEHEVPESVGRYLIRTFSGPPFFARVAEEGAAAETKLVTPDETKLVLPDEVKDEPAEAPVDLKPVVRKPARQTRTRKPRAKP